MAKVFSAQDLSGKALDWAVAKARYEVAKDCYLGGTLLRGWYVFGLYGDPNLYLKIEFFLPSVSQVDGGVIIDEARIATEPYWAIDGWWSASWKESAGDTPIVRYGETRLIAAMRCYVAAKLSEFDIEVPDELMGVA